MNSGGASWYWRFRLPEAIKRMPWLGWARRKTHPSRRRGIRLDCDLVRLARLLEGSTARRRQLATYGIAAAQWPPVSVLTVQENVPARALPGGKERPSRMGTFGWFDAAELRQPAYSFHRRNVPAWAGQAENPPKLYGDIRLASYAGLRPPACWFGGEMSWLGRSQAEKSAQALRDIRLAYVYASQSVPGLGWARRKTHPSREGHSSDPGIDLTN